jgi:hypothetical protein
VHVGDPHPADEVAERVAAERDDDARLHEGQLGLQPRHVVGDLVGARIAVAGRPRLDDVGDVHHRPIESRRAQ